MRALNKEYGDSGQDSNLLIVRHPIWWYKAGLRCNSQMGIGDLDLKVYNTEYRTAVVWMERAPAQGAVNGGGVCEERRRRRPVIWPNLLTWRKTSYWQHPKRAEITDSFTQINMSAPNLFEREQSCRAQKEYEAYPALDNRWTKKPISVS